MRALLVILALGLCSPVAATIQVGPPPGQKPVVVKPQPKPAKPAPKPKAKPASKKNKNKVKGK